MTRAGMNPGGIGQTAPVSEPGRSEVPHVPNDNTTLLAVLTGFDEDGWTENMSATDDGEVRCPQCGKVSSTDDVTFDRLRRLEGASDPDDMMAVIGVTCPNCEAKGVIVAHYGPNASEADAFLLQALNRRRPED
jgi:endogenous inhibitor of DNA gyrase (YacG/DUF329 family)